MTRLPKLILVLTLLVLLSFAASAVSAATLIIGTGDNVSRYAFGMDPGNATSQFPDFAAGGTYQQVYASNAFSGPITITQIAFASSSQASSGPGTGTYNFNVALSTTGTGPNGLSTDLAANRGANPVQVFSGPITATLTATDQFDLLIDITPFSYDPADGNLLIEVTVNSTAQFSGGLRLYFRAGSNPVTSRAYNPAGTVGGAGIDDFGLHTRFSIAAPTAAEGTITGRVTDANGVALSGVVMHLASATSSTAITDANGQYRFEDLDAANFCTITPELANYQFLPASRSFSLVGNTTDAGFTAAADPDISANAIDSNEYFVRQQYLDFLGREPDQRGLLYWSNRLNQCKADAACLHEGRIDVSAAFFKSVEFQKTGSYIYRIYVGALGRPLSYVEFSADRGLVVGGENLEADKAAFAGEFVTRPEFVQKYQADLSAESFVDALLQTLSNTTRVNLSSERADLITIYNSGRTQNESRGRVVADLAENSVFAAAILKPAFVEMEYFGYLRRERDSDGYAFWLNVLNDRDAENYRGMVCSFLTSAEYQLRFSTVVTHSNAECGR